MPNKTVREKIMEGREYRSFTPVFTAGEKVVEGYACTFDDEYLLWSEPGYRVREKIDPHAFDSCDMSDVVMQYNHEGRVFARNTNKTLVLTTDDHGLLIRADLGGTVLGVEIYNEIAGGYTDKMSFGFRVEKIERIVTENKKTREVDVLRIIRSIEKLYDVSAVSIPANDATEISARHIGEGVINEVRKEFQLREQRARQKQKIKILLEATR